MLPDRARRRAPSDGERGASLIIAVLFVGVVFTVVTVLLTQAQVTSDSLQVYRVDRGLRESADSSLQLTVQALASNPTTYGVDGDSSCSSATGMSYPLSNPSGATRSTFAPGSSVLVTCKAAPGSGVVTGGSQAPRDVQLTVTCKTSSPAVNASGQYLCGSGSVSRVIGRAHVRFDVDPGASNPVAWAVVPKILSWTLYR